MFLDDLLEESFMDNETNVPEEDVELESIMSEMDDLAIIECEEDDPFSAFLRVTCENTLNFNNIRNAIAMDELHYLKENGEELMMEAETEGGKSRIKKIFAAIQNALDKAFQKITGIVKAILTKFDSWMDTDKGFIKHNEKAIAKLTGNESIKMKGYKFDNTKLADISVFNKIEGFRSVAGVKAIVNSVLSKDAIDEYNKNKDSVAKSIYANVCGKECASSQEFAKAMFDYFREGGEKVEYTKPLDISMLRANVSTTKGTKDCVKKAYDGAKKFLAGLKKDAKQIETKVMTNGEKDKEKSAMMSSYVNIYTRIINLVTTVNTITMQEHVKALAQRNRMYKAMLVAAINASGKPASSDKKDDKGTPKNESASFLDNLELA